MVGHWSTESEGVRFNSLWGLRILSLSNAYDKTMNIFFLFLTKLKTYPLSYSICNIIDPHFQKMSDIFAPAFHYML